MYKLWFNSIVSSKPNSAMAKVIIIDDLQVHRDAAVEQFTGTEHQVMVLNSYHQFEHVVRKAYVVGVFEPQFINCGLGDWQILKPTYDENHMIENRCGQEEIIVLTDLMMPFSTIPLSQEHLKRIGAVDFYTENPNGSDQLQMPYGLSIFHSCIALGFKAVAIVSFNNHHTGPFYWSMKGLFNYLKYDNPKVMLYGKTSTAIVQSGEESPEAVEGKDWIKALKIFTCE